MGLPWHGFKWMNDKELIAWRKIPCILEVDLEYPNELHDLHNDYQSINQSIKFICSNHTYMIQEQRVQLTYI